MDMNIWTRACIYMVKKRTNVLIAVMPLVNSNGVKGHASPDDLTFGEPVEFGGREYASGQNGGRQAWRHAGIVNVNRVVFILFALLHGRMVQISAK